MPTTRPPEKLVACPDCGTANFTPRGLKSHRGGTNCKRVQAQASAPTPPHAKANALALADARAAHSLAIVPAGSTPVTLATLEVLPPSPVGQDRFALVNEYHEMARLSMAQSCAYMVLAGIELVGLKKDADHGTWQKLFVDRADAKSKNGFTFGFTYQTARNYEKFAEAAKKHVPALRDLCSDNTPLALMSPERRESLVAAVRKIGDGKTYGDLANEWGLAKKPRGSGAKGGDKGGGGSQGEDTEEEAAIDLWRPVIEGFFREAEEGSWAHLPDHGAVSKEALFEHMRLKLNTLAKEVLRK
jgi:hypothetical protein